MGAELVLLCLAAAAYSAILVNSIRSLALGRGWLDRPNGREGGPAYRPVPRIGGAGICGAIVFSLVICLALDPSHLRVDLLAVLAVTGAGLFLVGGLDDLRGLPAALKAVVLVGAGVVSLTFGVELHLGSSTVLLIAGGMLTVIWFVAVPAAINFVDGLDGLAAGLITLAAVVIALLGAVHGDLTTACAAAVVAAATLGFWHHNRHPARVFMGDGGAMMLGYLLAALSLRLLSTAGPLAFAVAVAALAWPLLDLALAVGRRVRRRALFSSDADHLHHRMARTVGHPVAVARIHRRAAGAAALALLACPPLQPLALGLLALLWGGLALERTSGRMARGGVSLAAAGALAALLLAAETCPTDPEAPRALTAGIMARGTPTAAETGLP